jgi:hypothetical protein
MRAEAPAWPPNARQPSTSTESPSDPAYTAVARPAGPAPTMATSYTRLGSMAPTRPMQRASSLSPGLRSTWPPGHTTMGSCPGSIWKRSISAFASQSVSGLSVWCGWPLRERKPRSLSTSPLSAWLTITGPPTPVSIKAHTPQDQRAHDPLPELRLRYQQGSQPLRCDDQGFHRTLRVGIHQSRPARQLS